MTFSDSKVAEHVNANYVPIWFNRGKGYHNCEHRTEEGIFCRSAEAYTTKKICTFLLDGDGKVVHYLAGYYAPPVFLDLIQPLSALQEAHGADDVRRFHRERLQSLAAKPITPSSRPFAYMGVTHSHSALCTTSLVEAASYLKRVHEQFVKDGSVPLEKVRYGYLFGNPFTEEPSEAAGFPRPQPPTKNAAENK